MLGRDPWITGMPARACPWITGFHGRFWDSPPRLNPRDARPCPFRFLRRLRLPWLLRPRGPLYLRRLHNGEAENRVQTDVQREEVRQLNVAVPLTLHREMRVRAAQEDITLREMCIRAIEDYLQK